MARQIVNIDAGFFNFSLVWKDKSPLSGSKYFVFLLTTTLPDSLHLKRSSFDPPGLEFMRINAVALQFANLAAGQRHVVAIIPRFANISNQKFFMGS
jgi:hypothetical protein